MNGCNFKFRNSDLQKIFDSLSRHYLENVQEKDISIYRDSIIRLKKYSKDERNILLAVLSLLMFFWLIDLNNKLIPEYYKAKLLILENLHRYEMEWNREKYLESIFEMDYEIFLVVIIIKLTILSYWKNYLDLIENKKNYFKSSWLIIPYLTLTESKFLWFFQDIYFKNLFPWKYKKTKNFYFKKMKKLELPGEHLISIINNLTDTMSDVKVIWKAKIRRKTYFSIYNKMKIKNSEDIFDILWVRIIFKSIQDLKKFSEEFEHKYVFINKKDYITHPKENWYKSLHYRFIALFRDLEIMVELQLRTDKMDRDIHLNSEISHFTYTLDRNKWAEDFEDVHFGFKYLNDYIKKYYIKKRKK